ncbi:DHH family phosphoesterase [Mesoplasma seiffertii]|uniref:DHH family phosphoesterase n=1 Tax=Mesoplasma seiffertii TaxID=28224 RepID=UPI00047AAE63|nr:bifunctional oligoribonuclease/PAP phosphatase NrnA [Mesoplasma seiffertii]
MNLPTLIEEKIKEFDTIIIHRHVLPDGDAYGSQLGLKYLIEKNYPNKKVYAQGNNIGYLDFIGKMDEPIADNLYNEALVIVTDCANVERIDDQRFSQGKYLIKIDHHPDATPYGDLSWVDTSFTSASEMVGYLAIQANWEITQQAARTIYHGICTDSGRFYFEGTSSRTFEVAAKLFETKFDFKELYNTMYLQTFEDLAAKSELINQAVVTEYGVGYIIIKDEFIKKHNFKYEDSGKFSNLLKGVAGIDIWIVFSIREDGKYRVEFRSKDLQINGIAAKWGGGGHRLAAGAIIDNLEQAMEIVADANELIKGN